MNTQPHLSKRGDVYQWRRKIRRFSTGNIDIKLSLGTTDRQHAHILARKVSAESDMIMEQIVGSRITPEQGRAFLSEVIRKERAKIAQLGMFSRVDSLDPVDDARHDAARGGSSPYKLSNAAFNKNPLERQNAGRHIILTHFTHKPKLIEASEILSIYWEFLERSFGESSEIVIFEYSGNDLHLNRLISQMRADTVVNSLNLASLGKM